MLKIFQLIYKFSAFKQNSIGFWWKLSYLKNYTEDKVQSLKV